MNKLKVYMGMAKELSKLSTCPRRNVGVIITNWEDASVSWGYNGAPKRIKHCADKGCNMIDGHCSTATHAEINAILMGDRIEMSVGNIYIYGGAPCYRCSQAIIQSQIKYVYHSIDDNLTEDQQAGSDMLDEAGIIRRIVPL